MLSVYIWVVLPLLPEVCKASLSELRRQANVSLVCHIPPPAKIVVSGIAAALAVVATPIQKLWPLMEDPRCHEEMGQSPFCLWAKTLCNTEKQKGWCNRRPTPSAVIGLTAGSKWSLCPSIKDAVMGSLTKGGIWSVPMRAISRKRFLCGGVERWKWVEWVAEDTEMPQFLL